MKNKDQQAQEFADNKFPEFLDAIQNEPWPKIKDMLAQVHIDGYTACEQSMWRSVEEEMPEVDNKVIVRVPADEFYAEYVTVAYWDGEDWIEKRRCEVIRPSHFMYIPFPPDTNTEKKC